MTFRHWRKTRLAIVAGTLLVIVLVIIIGYHSFDNAAGRCLYFGLYANAITTWQEERGEDLPATLGQLVRVHNASEYSRYKIPMDESEMARRQPIYRSMQGSEAGQPFLYLIEEKPRKWYAFGRWVIYACPDGSQIRMEFIVPWELDDRIAEDDKRRRASGM